MPKVKTEKKNRIHQDVAKQGNVFLFEYVNKVRYMKWT